MRKLLLLAIVLVGLSCDEKNSQVTQSGQVTFSFKKLDAESIAKTTDVPVPAFVSYTLRKSDGTAISNKIELYEFNGDFVTQPEQLDIGAYELTQFLILDANNATIYAAPVTGSAMADLVEEALPIPFIVSKNETANISPDVLALADHTPEDFGYITFGFEVVNVTALIVPIIEENISKVSYQFINGTEKITGNAVPVNSILNLNNPSLLGKTWQTRILVWTDSVPGCYPKVYRYHGELTFNGNLIELESVENQKWAQFFYKEKTKSGHKYGIFRSVDPRLVYKIEIQLPQQNSLAYGTVDRCYYTDTGYPLCDCEYKELRDPVDGLISASFPISSECPTGHPNLSMDSFFSITVGSGDVIQDYCEWTSQGEMITYCPTETSIENVAIINSRRPVSLSKRHSK